MAAGDQKPFTLQVVAEDREEGADRSVRRQSDQESLGKDGFLHFSASPGLCVTLSVNPSPLQENHGGGRAQEA